MKIPEKVSLKELDNVIEGFRSNCYERRGILYHNDCDTKIEYSIRNISIHDRDSYEGTVEVAIRLVPYCPECEESFRYLARVHENMEDIHQKTFSWNRMLSNRTNILSFLFGGGIGALLMYLVLSFVYHR